MQISVKTTNDVKVLAFEGRLDTQTSPDAQKELTRLIEDQALRKALGVKARVKFETTFSLAVRNKHYEKLYQESVQS